MPESALQAAGEEQTAMVLPSAGHYRLQYQPVRQDVPTVVIVVTVLKATNHFLIG